MELTKREIEILLALILHLTDDDSVEPLEDYEQALIERMESSLGKANIAERTAHGIASYTAGLKINTTMTVHRNENGWQVAWLHLDGTMECAGSLVPARDTLLGGTGERFSMSVWNGKHWVTTNTLGGED